MCLMLFSKQVFVKMRPRKPEYGVWVLAICTFETGITSMVALQKGTANDCQAIGIVESACN